jgi:hypothetical protein
MVFAVVLCHTYKISKGSTSFCDYIILHHAGQVRCVLSCSYLLRLTAYFLGRLTAACLPAFLWLPSPLLCGLLIWLTAACLSSLLQLPSLLAFGLLVRLTACFLGRLTAAVCQASCGLQACLFVAYYCLLITVG